MGNTVNSYLNAEGSKRSNGFNWGTTSTQVARDISLKGKNVIITGANTGIGKETARVMAKMGAHVIIACRSADRAEGAIAEIKKENPDADIHYMQLDLTSLKSIKKFADEFNKLDKPLNILLNNAGIMATNYQLTEDGFESQFGTNHIGHFYLTKLLYPKLKEGAPSRVVNVASAGHRMCPVHFDDLQATKLYERYGGKWLAYGQSKTANILFSYELNKRMQQDGIGLSVSLHPGGIKTELGRSLDSLSVMFLSGFSLLFKTIEQGAATSIYCCTAPEVEQQNLGGKYFSDSNEAVPAAHALDPEAAKKLWDVSEELIASKQPVA